MAGPQSPVTGGAVYIAAADFNNDGIDDAAVIGKGSALTVLFGSSDGSFKSPVVSPVARYLHGIVTGDFSGHKTSNQAAIDIAVVSGSKVYILPEQVQDGMGTGTFGKPVSFPVRHTAADIAAGYFDCPLGCADANLKRLDLVTANGRSNTLVLLFDPNPQNRKYQSPPDIATGLNPHAVKAADFDGNGADDIAVLLTGYSGADAVSVYLNNGTGSFSSAPVSYPVGMSAQALTVGNFHSNIDTDSVQDIAVLNRGSGVTGTTESSVSFLLNRTTRSPGGTLQGTGSFDVLFPFRVSCPAKFQGIPITCAAQDIISGDFDGDGFSDFAVSFSTQSQTTTSVNAGFVNVYTGRGNGLFDFATQVLVGLAPHRMVVGDFTGHGNGVKDIAVTESGTSTVRILRNVPPPPKPGGWTCRSDDQCQVGLHCVDHICCALPDDALSCPSGEFCNISGSLGTCSPPGPSGIPCGSAQECQTGFCVDGFCCTAASCSAGEYCNTGACAAPALSGSPCSRDEQCATGHCVDGVCCDSDLCSNSEACDVPGSEGQCASLLPLGNACTNSNQCASPGFCADGVCCYSEWCPAGQACNIAGSLGQCAYLPTPTPTPTRTPTITWTPTPTLTPTPVPIGGPCSAGSQCASTFCVDSVCCKVASCPAGQICDYSFSSGDCHIQGDNGTPCQKDDDCSSNYCAPNGTGRKCAPAPTATPTPTPTQTPTQTPLSPGDPCFVTSQCPSPLVCSVDEHVCCMTSQCPTGQSCKLPGSPGWCTIVPTATATPTATPTVTPTPCDEASCEAPGLGWRCDITGYVGTCSEPLAVGTPCGKTNDCEAGLLCNPDEGCVLTTTPTEAPLPTETPCPPGQVIVGGICAEVHTSRSGGCSIGDPSARGTAAPVTSAAGTDTWLVALLPLALAIRRLRRQETRARRHRPIRIAPR